MDKRTRIHLAQSPEGKKLNVPTGNQSVIFTAGPIRNAPPWQEDAIRLLLEKNQDIFVASPVRKLSNDLMPLVETDKGYEEFERQRAWEQNYLYAAAQKGCIIFWLPKESVEKEFLEKVYAHITMMELGQWIARCKSDKSIRMVIGTDKDFPEWRTILFELQTEIPHIPICYSLTETIETALSYCN